MIAVYADAVPVVPQWKLPADVGPNQVAGDPVRMGPIAIVEDRRKSARCLLEQIDRSREAVLEKCQQDRLLFVIRQAGAWACATCIAT